MTAISSRLLQRLMERKHLSIILLLILSLGWFGLTTIGWFFIKYRRGFTDVSYLDIVFPTRWRQHQQKMGDFYVARAKLLFSQGDYASGGDFLRAGVARSPENIDGQVLLANFYAALDRPDLARAVWEQNFEKLKLNSAHLRASLSFFAGLREDKIILEKCLALLNSGNALDQATQHMLAAHAADAAFNLGDYQEAEQLVRRFLPTNSVDTTLITTKIEWDRGYRDLALQNLRAAITRFPEEDALRTTELVFLRLNGDVNAWANAVIERIVANPDSGEAYIEYIHLLRAQQKHERASAEAESYLQRFSQNPTALLALADFAAKTGQPKIALQVQHLLENRGPFGAPASLMVIEAHVMAHDYQTAISLCADYATKSPEWVIQYAAVLHGLQAIAYNGLGKKDEARLQLGLLFDQRNLRAENLVAVASQLSAQGSRDLALETLARAVEADPRNESALTNLIQTQLDLHETAEITQHLPQFLANRKPSRELATKIYRELGSDQHLFDPQHAAHLASLKELMEAKTP